MVIGLVGVLLSALVCGPAGAWSHAGRFGTASGGGGAWSAQGFRGGAASGGEGAWSGTGFRGGTASGGGGAWRAQGAYGGSAAGGRGAWSATGPAGTTAYHTSGYATAAYGTTAYGGYHYYGGTYAAYHPPTTVNYYGATCGTCGGWSTAGAAAAGAAVGLVAGAATTAYAMGAMYATLPNGCTLSTAASTSYYHCGTTWFQPSYGANGIYYRVVPTP